MEGNNGDGGSNKYCKLANLHNESDVEQFFLLPLLKELGFTEDFLGTKSSIAQRNISKVKKRRLYRPDYIGYGRAKHRDPCLVVDAKSPDESAEDGVEEAQLYAAVLRRKLSDPKPDQFCVGSNGHKTIVKHFERDEALMTLDFADFVPENEKFQAMVAELSRSTLSTPKPVAARFRFENPGVEAIPRIFEACHKLIWKTEKRSPASAFYEFAKIMYVKMEEDRRIQPHVQGDHTVPPEHIRFSTMWIDGMVSQGTKNPIDDVMFKTYRDELRKRIRAGEKKRIFGDGEAIDLLPSTTYEVVRKLEHYDFHGVDEDLNGKLFETFLTATMRGQDLGQFFTPRSVVKFMIQMANPRCSASEIDTILDGCCGTGGFLIEAMAVMDQKIQANARLSSAEKDALGKKLRTETLWGIDAGKDPPIARIARLNMLLHRDGGSRIYFADALDKQMDVDPNLPDETAEERQELRKEVVEKRRQFDAVLTNPPFSMRYERDKPADLRVVERYSLSRDKEGKPRASLRSAVMFLERYEELLKPGGKLLTVMDESVLNTVSMRFVRDFIRERFVVVAVISLPISTFAKAGGSVKTSVLYLRKKTNPDETQPAVFMAVSENVGHDDAGKSTPEKNDLPSIYREFEEFLSEK